MSDTNITATSHFPDIGQIRVMDLEGAIPYGISALPLGPKDVAFED